MKILSWFRHHQNLSIFVFFALLSVPLTYPLLFHFTGSVPGHGADDPYVVWNIWWVKWSLLDLGSNPLFSSYIFYPIGVNLGTYTLTLLNGVISIPLQLAWDVIPANNLLVWFSIGSGAFASYLLATDILGRRQPAAHLGAIAAGLVYGFGAYRFNYLYLGGFNFISNQWLPFYILYLRRIFRTRAFSPRPGVIAGLFLVFAGWTESTFTAFSALFTGMYLLFQLLVQRRHFFRPAVILNLLSVLGVTIVGLLPLLVSVGGDLARYGNFLSTGPQRAEFLSADLLSFFIPSQFNPFLGWMSKNLSYHNMDFAFVGWLTLLFALVGLVAMRARAQIVFWGIAAIFFAAIMLGPVLHVSNQGVSNVPLPYRLVQSIPLLGANRLPVRYNHFLMLAVAMLTGAGVSAVLTRFPQQGWLAVLFPALILAEHVGVPLSMSDLTAPVVYDTISKEQGDFSILDLPISWSSSTAVQGRLYTQSQFYQTVHHKRLLGGNTSRPPPFEFQYFNEIPVIHSIIQLENGVTVDEGTIEQDEIAGPEVAEFFGLRYVVARLDKTEPAVLDYVRRVFHLVPLYSDSRVLAFRVNPTPQPNWSIDPGQPLSNMYYDDNWGRPQQGPDGKTFRWATASGAVTYAPLVPIDYQLCGSFAGARDGQLLRLSLNGNTFAEVTLSSNWGSHCVTLPAQLIRPGINTLAFASEEVPLAGSTVLEKRTVGKTAATTPADIAVTSAGFLAGKFASISVNGHELYSAKRGFYLLALGPGQVDSSAWQAFDTFRDQSESSRMVAYIQSLTAGSIVAGAVSDEASQNLSKEAVDALRTLGTEIDLRSRFRVSYAFIGVKGAAPGSAVEAIDPNFPANVSVGKDVTRPTVTFALGSLEFTQLPK